MAIKQGVLDPVFPVFGACGCAHLADLTGSFKASSAVLGGFTLTAYALIRLIGHEASRAIAMNLVLFSRS